MAKSLKKRVKLLETLVENLARKIEALGRPAAKKAPKRRAKASKTPVKSVASKVKPAVKPAAVKPATPTAPSESAAQSGVA
ncbi:MAG TPA: hypothetical protein VEU51_13410 [Candidatus Acidoferrales bacterium]|nr:hypothetical protein [Candidatus Acidoferrales bacterium]